MKFSMTGQNKGDLNTSDCLTEVTVWAGLTVPIKSNTILLNSETYMCCTK